ncbi:hypothetical protein SK128_016606 [Halocaridina rubra]|uniref:Uncharacterized protein n=1 Tax=Halocaridina rubra TaxID=373956 RepID=A0AAN8X153_HALRR
MEINRFQDAQRIHHRQDHCQMKNEEVAKPQISTSIYDQESTDSFSHLYSIAGFLPLKNFLSFYINL